MSAIVYSVADRIATITLNRPDKLNAMNIAMIQELIGALDLADADDAVRAVVITGSGRAFCAGADLSAGAATFDYDSQDGAAVNSATAAATAVDYSHPRVRDSGGLLTLRMYRSLKPLIGAINGAAVGGGVSMILPMDARFASTEARFGFVFARRGIVPEGASSWFLPRLVGLDRALDWCLTGRIISAQEALAAGLVRSLHAPEDLLAAAYAHAREIADNTAPVSVALTRQMLWRMASAGHPMEAHRLDSRGVFARGRSADAREGVTSFLEKRKPNFTDRVADGMPDYFPWWEEPDYS
ncbi:MAG: crotonase/enoyl-CoA hydratase family protein [Burkholderiales bacterium]